MTQDINPQKIRKALGLSQSQFAKAYALPPDSVKHWEHGKRKLDSATLAYYRVIAKYPKEAMDAQKAEISCANGGNEDEQKI